MESSKLDALLRSGRVNPWARTSSAATVFLRPWVQAVWVSSIEPGVHDGSPWYAMDLLEGESLRQFGQRIWSPYRQSLAPLAPTAPVSATAGDTANSNTNLESKLRAGSAPTFLGGVPPVAAGQLNTALRFFARICATLAYLHGEGYVNCDLKPENILLINDEPIIIDFGLSSQHPGGSGREALEAQRGMAGTLPYMSPEQLRGDLLDVPGDPAELFERQWLDAQSLREGFPLDEIHGDEAQVGIVRPWIMVQPHVVDATDIGMAHAAG